MGTESLLQLENLKVDFFLRSGRVTAINGLDLQLERSQVEKFALMEKIC